MCRAVSCSGIKVVIVHLIHYQGEPMLIDITQWLPFSSCKDISIRSSTRQFMD